MAASGEAVDKEEDDGTVAEFDESTCVGRFKRGLLNEVLNTNWFNTLTGLVTTFALFGDDIRIMAFTGRGSADLTFSILNVIGMAIFTFEIGGLCSTKAEYFNGFYFWLDVVSTASMIFDIKWLNPGATDGSASVARTGKVSKSAKGGRIVRIARLVRLVRILKLFKMKKNLESSEDEEEDEDEEMVSRQPSKVAKKLTELTTRHIIRILIVMVAVFPLFDNPSAFDSTIDGYVSNGLVFLYNIRPKHLDLDVEMPVEANERGSQFCLANPQHEFCLNLRQWTQRCGKLRYLRIHHVRYDDFLKALYFHAQGRNKWKRPKGKRESEKRPYTKKNKACEVDPCTHAQRWNPRHDLVSRDSKLKTEFGWRFDTELMSVSRDAKLKTYAIIEITSSARFDAMLNLIRMVVVMVVLVSAVVVFTQDATTLVVGPIERMMTLVQRIAENPLADMKAKKRPREGHDPSDETYLLEQTLAKISGLLQVGFGVAGAEVISKSMSTDGGCGGDRGVNYMLPGKKITAVFGFAIIEDFTVTCSCLEEETCTYINTIAKIVHEAAHAFHGAPNKNIGCAFLCVWKICEGLLPGIRDLRDSEPPPNTPEFRQWRTAQRVAIAAQSQALGQSSRLVPPLEMVESSLASFLKAQVDLHRANQPESGVLAPFVDHPKMVAEFGNDFKVRMGFGLHIGWAIEGTIGSRFKIDASYLSPNVNTSARLEAATHMYNCPLLMSGFFVDEMSPAARSFCRMIDVVSVKGSQVPLELWTFDVSNYPQETLLPTFDNHMVQNPVDFSNDIYYRELQKGIDPIFMQSFNDAVQEYVAGDWAAAKEHLTDALKRYPEDGPSKVLMRVLAKDRFLAPSNWKGFRALTSKT
ncbi:hypothetical protein CTAYLR_008409 [Chrysophaeum taylorii]|uniref:Guanylate cyclase domain-containing protein n=1 Tax=Chrysophaeum taylorii TaxID=2483200 RepID=A0AAD7UK08_9STRA|nr:hypothetical protein CTAYLR_008409 [Chrysophaeum taylorii]